MDALIRNAAIIAGIAQVTAQHPSIGEHVRTLRSLLGSVCMISFLGKPCLRRENWLTLRTYFYIMFIEAC
jgi:hypothetical protein